MKLRQRTEQIFKFQRPQQPKPPKIKIPIIPDLGRGQLQRIANEVTPEKFEAVGFRFGKEVSLGFGTKEKSAEKLSKFLGGTLGASGFLQTKEGKIKAEETGLLKQFGLRKSKVSEFLVVEEKSKRLRKGGTGKDIQYFRTKAPSKKGRKSKTPFGL